MGGTLLSVEEPVYYQDYLHLDQLLGAQQLESTRQGRTAHDEMLFIIVHQAFELWFKQILWELDLVRAVLGGTFVDDRELARAVAALGRIRAIQPLLIQQLEVLETMTPLDFLDFRDLLIPASGFQSLQFRLIENRLGIAPEQRLKILGAPYTSRLREDHVDLVAASESEPSVVDLLDRWLARTPFLEDEGFDFWAAYRTAVDAMLARDRETIEHNPALDEVVRDQQRDVFAATTATFETLFDEDRYEELRANGRRRLAQRSFLAALQISLYRDEPALQTPFRLLTTLTDIDEGLTAWRYRHALLAQRLIGSRIGTGGTSGHAYLKAAAERHRIFVDLIELATFHIPRSELPELPASLRRRMQLRYFEDDTR